MKLHFEFSMSEVAVFTRVANRYNDVIRNVVLMHGKSALDIEKVPGELPEMLVEKKHFSMSATKSTEVYEVDIRIEPRVTDELEFVLEAYIEAVEAIVLAAVAFWKTIRGSLRAYERAINKFVQTITEE